MREDSGTGGQAGDAELARMLAEHLYTILVSASASQDTEMPEAIRGIEKARQLHDLLWGMRNLALSLSGGDLDYACKERGFAVGALKGLQSNLRYLTWQTQRIAGGDYTHRVKFLGDFAEAFNKMTEKLAGAFDTLTTISEEYKDLAEHDPLTRLYNRNGFFEFARKALRAVESAESSLIMADIDHFKRINDTFGHACGDVVLRVFSEKLLSLLRVEDLCCRYGGEEFVILMPGNPRGIGIVVAERLRAAVEEMRIPCAPHEIRITASFGLSAVSPADPDKEFDARLEACMREADAKLYAAKSAGRNRVVA